MLRAKLSSTLIVSDLIMFVLVYSNYVGISICIVQTLERAGRRHQPESQAEKSSF